MIAADVNGSTLEAVTTAKVMALAARNGLFGKRSESLLFAQNVLENHPQFSGAYYGYEPNADGLDAEAKKNLDRVPAEALGNGGRFIPYYFRDRADATKISLTPLVLMAQRLSQRGASIRMLFGARSEAELAFADVLRKHLGGRLQTAIADKGEQISFETEIAALPKGGLMLICGPLPMLDAARAAWTAAGRPLADLRYETFGSSGRFAPHAFRLQVPRHNLDITVEAQTSLLETLEGAGIMAMYGCRRGECGLCTMDVLALDGEIDHRDVFLSEHEKTANQRMCVCVSRVLGTVTLETAYRPEA